MRNSSRPLLLAGFIVALASNTIAAQEPTQAERDAIRSACRSDFMAHCASVQPGGKEALECLLKNDSQLSPSCKSAVSAVVRKPEPAAQEPAASTSAPAGDAAKARSTQTQDEQIKALRQACTLDDFMAHCSWIQPSSPEVVLCLKANAAGLSPSCRAAIASRSDTPPPSLPADIGRKEQTTPEPRKPEPAHASPLVSSQTGMLRKPTGEQKNAIRAACRSDFISHCPAVQPGGTQAMRCLQRNAGQLSPPCKTALAAVTGGATASPPAMPAENATPTAVAPLAPMPALRPRTAMAILRICGEEMRLLCGDIPSGGGRVISCLAEHAQRLSPVCYRALAAARNY
jgi:cysteine rich repeat protein